MSPVNTWHTLSPWVGFVPSPSEPTSEPTAWLRQKIHKNPLIGPMLQFQVFLDCFPNRTSFDLTCFLDWVEVGMPNYQPHKKPRKLPQFTDAQHPNPEGYPELKQHFFVPHKVPLDAGDDDGLFRVDTEDIGGILWGDRLGIQTSISDVTSTKKNMAMGQNSKLGNSIIRYVNTRYLKTDSNLWPKKKLIHPHMTVELHAEELASTEERSMLPFLFTSMRSYIFSKTFRSWLRVIRGTNEDGVAYMYV